MSRLVSLAEVISSARQLADATGTTGEGFIENPDLTAWANEELGHYHSLLVQAEPDRFRESVSYTADGSASYDLPADFLSDLFVERVEGTERYNVPRLMPHERNDYGHGSGEAQGYEIVGDELRLYPLPSSGTYNLIYVTRAPVLAQDEDTFDGVGGWESMVIFGLALRIGIKEAVNRLDIERQRDRIEAHIRNAARKRHLANPARIIDVGPKRSRAFWQLRHRFRGW